MAAKNVVGTVESDVTLHTDTPTLNTYCTLADAHA
jgi:hypothetical protein